ncbi:MAG: Carboxy-terminal processing protease CtpA [candidate division WS2 bacterium]|nr:Carboxy-terminal processing protease CtpA [Candidatus Psychracetigena formicireducens]
MNKIPRIALVIILSSILFAGGVFFGRTTAPVRYKDFLPLSDEQHSVIRQVIEYIEKESYFKEEFTPEKIYQGIIRGIVNSLGDPYSYYLGEEDYQHLRDESRGYYGGVGIQIGIRDGRKVVIAPFTGTPADRAGVKAGDVILRVNNTPVGPLTLEKVAGTIRGKPGTKVTIEFGRGEETYEVELTREIIKIVSVEHKIIDNNVGYIKVTLFNEPTASDVRKALEDLKNKGVRALILDLRNNPGGLLDSSVEVARFFLRGEIVSVVHSNGRIDTLRGNNPFVDLPLVVWVNSGTASAAEILAGALQDHDAAYIIGRNTFGKGSVQRVWGLDDGGAVRLTIARYRLPSGRIVDEQELVPDLILPIDATEENYIEETLKYLK